MLSGEGLKETHFTTGRFLNKYISVFMLFCSSCAGFIPSKLDLERFPEDLVKDIREEKTKYFVWEFFIPTTRSICLLYNLRKEPVKRIMLRQLGLHFVFGNQVELTSVTSKYQHVLMSEAKGETPCLIEWTVPQNDALRRVLWALTWTPKPGEGAHAPPGRDPSATNGRECAFTWAGSPLHAPATWGGSNHKVNRR